MLWIALLTLAMVFAGLRAWGYAAPRREREHLSDRPDERPSRVQVLLGVVPFLGIAGFLVGYGAATARLWVALYGALAAVYFGYVLWRARRRREQSG